MDWNAIFRNSWKLAACLTVPLIIIGLVLIFRASTRSSKSSEIYVPVQPGATNIKLWPNARVTYTIDSELNMAQALIRKAIKGIEDGTCIRFIDKASSHDRHWINFIQDDSDCGYPETVGMAPQSRQDITISGDCLSSGQIQRNLGLALGLGFEETRPDRSKYVRYNANLPDCNEEVNNTSAELAKRHHPAAAAILFDFVSHMFVDTKCFGPVPGAGIGKLRQNPRYPLMLGSSEDEHLGTFSVLDLEKLNAMYQCTGCLSYRFRHFHHVADQIEPFESFYPVVGGEDINRTKRYICRVYHHGSLLIGKAKVDEDENICWIADAVDSKEHIYRKNFELLTNPEQINLKWVRVDSNSNFPNNTITGGRTVDRRPIYIGRCMLTRGQHTSLIPGSVFPGSSSMSVGFAGQAFNCLSYEVLVCAE